LESGVAYQPEVYTLSMLTAGIAKVFEESFPKAFWVKAEIAKLNHYTGSGHCYPSLVEKEKGAIKAEMRGTIWANDFLRINQKFLMVTKEPLKEGIQILFRAMVKYHPVYGLSLQISDIDPSYTLGEMAREKNETINKLKNEGLFDRNRLLPIPLLPQRIAIISVDTSKGFSDFINIINNNSWGYLFSFRLFPALLQGDKAVESISGQLRAISRVADQFDVLVIIRGGGGDVGLNCYDNYLLAKEVALCPLPVLTGIGHSTNETVIEMIAAHNKITPTDVAYFLIQYFHNFSARLDGSMSRISKMSRDLLEEEKRRWGETTNSLLLQTGILMNLEKNRLGVVSSCAITGSRTMLAENKHDISMAASRLSFKPRVLIREKQSEVKNKSDWFAMRIRYLMAQYNQSVSTLEQKIQLLDPEYILKRGFSITYLDKKPLTDTDGLNPGDTIITKLYKGTIYSEIKSIKE